MKKDKQDNSQQKGKRPFFARLLEAQELEEAAGGASLQTLKFPSDSDEGPVTKKYPSDCEDGY
ncbi:microviridin/marinostatin family tricyclic proteinase inhibitor [Cystobacter fuscus]|uniref:microviridin/marinostatin family tricyclic proteinase inhibitor n=1 Tax=Cystobacter fuscus TaxID=43 RepID=UPI002B2FA4EE|nr:microviridin/marinostatin family tricyclic proteinase inhibitor [Cystobacter fuscus]